MIASGAGNRLHFPRPVFKEQERIKFWSKNAILAVAAVSVAGLGSIALPDRAKAQAGQARAKTKAGDVFKNVTTSTLMELTPDDFLGAMGVMADSLRNLPVHPNRPDPRHA